MKDYTFIEKPAVLDKYKAASKVANEALQKAISLCKPGSDIYEICTEVDKFIDEGLRKEFNNKKTKKLERGIAFPTCLSVNNVAEYYSPL
jgi:methionine aminopeptidase